MRVGILGSGVKSGKLDTILRPRRACDDFFSDGRSASDTLQRFAGSRRQPCSGGDMSAGVAEHIPLKRFLAGAALILAACSAERRPRLADSTTASPVDSTTAQLTEEPLRALGTEPFWALDVDHTGLRFITPEDTSGIRFPPIAPRSVGDTVTWVGQAERAAIEARIWPQKCSDGMSDREYPYTVRVTVDGTTHRGCADGRRVIVPPT